MITTRSVWTETGVHRERDAGVGVPGKLHRLRRGATNLVPNDTNGANDVFIHWPLP